MCSFASPLLFLPLACGGGGAESDGAKVAGRVSAVSAPRRRGAGAPDGAHDDAWPSRTAGDLQGAKLTETKTVASTRRLSERRRRRRDRTRHEPGRGPEDIRAIIMARRDEARACYDAGLKDHPGIEGDLVIAWTIDPKGNVTQASLDSSRSQIAEPTVVACVTDIIKKVQFAPSPGGFETKAFYPFNFHPHHGTLKPHPVRGARRSPSRRRSTAGTRRRPLCRGRRPTGVSRGHRRPLRRRAERCPAASSPSSSNAIGSTATARRKHAASRQTTTWVVAAAGRSTGVPALQRRRGARATGWARTSLRTAG